MLELVIWGNPKTKVSENRPTGSHGGTGTGSHGGTCVCFYGSRQPPSEPLGATDLGSGVRQAKDVDIKRLFDTVKGPIDVSLTCRKVSRKCNLLIRKDLQSERK
jgi:hypothetical protein